MAGVEAGALQLRHGARIDPAGFHEVQRLADPGADFGELFRPGRTAHEIERPLVDLAQVGITAGRERAHQVQRRGRLRIGLEQALRIGDAGLGRELDPVDVVTQVARQFDPVDHLDRR